MSIISRVSLLASQRGLSNLSVLSKESGLGESTIYDWKRHTPNINAIVAVAKTLDVSVDYLLGMAIENPHQVTLPLDLNKVTDETLNNYLVASRHSITIEDWRVIQAVLHKYKNE